MLLIGTKSFQRTINEPFLHVMRNFTPNKIVLDGREPPWFDRKIKHLIKQK